MKNSIKSVLVGAICLTFAACDVDKTKEGELPDVDVDVNTSGGQLPEFNVEGPSVEVGTKKETVEVPTVDVKVPDDDKK